MSSAPFSRVVLLMLILLFALGLMAQTPVGQILGTVRDPSGAAIAGAPVVVTNLATGQTFDVKTDAAGDYLVRELPPGSYSVAASFTGFKQSVRTPITLVAFQNARVDLGLQLGATSENVVVTGEAPQVDTRSNTLGANVNDTLITEMPISNRNIIQTINYTPGVQNVSAGDNVNRNQQRLNINGNRSYSTNTQLDGAAMYFAHRGQGIEMPTPDAIQEVQVVTSGVSAEFGRGTAVFAAVTKSGGNQLHGSVWEFARNDAFDSTPYFQKSKPRLRAHDFGVTAGGPIIKNRLFFFVAYQGLRLHQNSQTSAPFTPTQAERAGDFSASSTLIYDPLTCVPGPCQQFTGNQIPTDRFDPIAVKVLGMIPTPNLPSGALSFSGPNPTTGDGFTGKFDFAATDKDRLNFRWFWDYRRSVSPFPASPKQSIPGYSPAPTSQDPKTATLNYVRTWSPSLLSTTTASFTKWVYDEGTTVTTGLAELGATNFVDQFPTHRLPTLTVSGRFSATATTIDQRMGVDYGLSQKWDWVHGSHEFRWGTQVERISYRKPNSSTSAGTFTFDGSVTKGPQRTGNPMADFLLGRARRLDQSSGSVSSGHYYPMGFYGQDTWKAAPRLTLTMGLRWDIYTAWREHKGQQVMYIPGVQSTTFATAPLGMVFQSDPEFTYHTAWKNFGPRVGFAWDVFGDGRTAVRGGYGISYDPLVAEPVIHGTQPFSYSIRVNNPGPLSNPYQTVTNPFPYVVDPSAAVFNLPAGVEGISGPFRPMYNQNFTLTLERQISNTWAVTASYVGNQSRHGYSGFEANPAVYAPLSNGTLPSTGNTDLRRVHSGCLTAPLPCTPLYSSMQSYSSNLNTSYNAFQAFVTKRASHGLSVQAHYTWSRVIDQCSTEVIGSCAQQDPYNPAGERGVGDFDRTHVGVITYIYEVPKLAAAPRFLRQVIGGWQLASYHVFQSGQPFTVFTASDASLTDAGYDRPNQVGDPHGPIPPTFTQVPGAIYWFNPTAFVPNSPGQYGNTSRNSLRAPYIRRWDMSLKKIFYPYGERYRLEFRGDINNILNHTILAAPGAEDPTSTSFGVISSTEISGRVVRLGLHLDF